MKKKLLITAALVLALAVAFIVGVHAYADYAVSQIYQKNLEFDPGSEQYTLTIPAAFLRRYASLDGAVKSTLDILAEEAEGFEEPETLSEPEMWQEDGSIVMTMPKEGYDCLRQVALALPRYLEEFLQEGGAACSFNEDYTRCDIIIDPVEILGEGNEQELPLLPIFAKIILDWYHAFDGTLDQVAEVYICDRETGRELDNSEKYGWVMTVGDIDRLIDFDLENHKVEDTYEE